MKKRSVSRFKKGMAGLLAVSMAVTNTGGIGEFTALADTLSDTGGISAYATVSSPERNSGEMNIMVYHHHINDNTVTDEATGVITDGSVTITADPYENTEMFTGYTVSAGNDAVTGSISWNDEKKPVGSLQINYTPDVHLVKIDLFYTKVNEGVAGDPFGAENGSKFPNITSPEIDTAYDAENEKYYNTNAGLHTDRSIEEVTAENAGVGMEYEDGREYDLTLEAWYVDDSVADIGLVLDASGSMAFTKETPLPIKVPDGVLSEDDYDSDGFLKQSAIDKILDKELTDNSQLGYSDYSYFIYDPKAATKEFVPIGYWDGTVGYYDASGNLKVIEQDPEPEDQTLPTDGLVGYYNFGDGGHTAKGDHTSRMHNGSPAADAEPNVDPNAFDNGEPVYSATFVKYDNGRFVDTETQFSGNGKNATAYDSDVTTDRSISMKDQAAGDGTKNDPSGIMLDVKPDLNNGFTVSFAARLQRDNGGSSAEESEILYIGSKSDVTKGFEVCQSKENSGASIYFSTDVSQVTRNGIWFNADKDKVTTPAWQVITFSVDKDGNITWYVDGNKPTTGNTTGNIDISNLNAAEDLVIILAGTADGKYGDATKTGNTNYLDEVYVYNRVLKAEEVSALYNIGYNGSSSSAPATDTKDYVAVFKDSDGAPYVMAGIGTGVTDHGTAEDGLITRTSVDSLEGWYYVNSASSYTSIYKYGTSKEFKGLDAESGNTVSSLTDAEKKYFELSSGKFTLLPRIDTTHKWLQDLIDAGKLTEGIVLNGNEAKSPAITLTADTCNRPMTFWVDSEGYLRCYFNSGSKSSNNDIRSACSYVFTKRDDQTLKTEELQYALAEFSGKLADLSPDSRVAAVRFSASPNGLTDDCGNDSNKIKQRYSELVMLDWTNDPVESSDLFNLKRGDGAGVKGHDTSDDPSEDDLKRDVAGTVEQYNYFLTGGTYTDTGLKAFYENLILNKKSTSPTSTDDITKNNRRDLRPSADDENNDSDISDGVRKYLVIFTDGQDNNIQNFAITGTDANGNLTYKYKKKTGDHAQDSVAKFSDLDSSKYAEKIRKAGYTIFGVILANGTVAEGTDEFIIAQDYLRYLSNNHTYVFSTDNVKTDENGEIRYTDLSTIFEEEIFKRITRSLAGYTVGDYIDPRFDIRDASGNKIYLGSGGKIVVTENGEEAEKTVSRTQSYEFRTISGEKAHLYYNNDPLDSRYGLYFIRWEDQTIPGCSVGADELSVWTGKVRLVAKEDFLGGNAVLTSGHLPNTSYTYTFEETSSDFATDEVKNYVNPTEDLEIKVGKALAKGERYYVEPSSNPYDDSLMIFKVSKIKGTENLPDDDYMNFEETLEIINYPSKGFPRTAADVKIVDPNLEGKNEIKYLGENRNNLKEIVDALANDTSGTNNTERFYWDYIRRYGEKYGDAADHADNKGYDYDALLDILAGKDMTTGKYGAEGMLVLPYAYLPSVTGPVKNQVGTEDHQEDIIGTLTYKFGLKQDDDGLYDDEDPDYDEGKYESAMIVTLDGRKYELSVQYEPFFTNAATKENPELGTEQPDVPSAASLTDNNYRGGWNTDLVSDNQQINGENVGVYQWNATKPDGSDNTEDLRNIYKFAGTEQVKTDEVGAYSFVPVSGAIVIQMKISKDDVDYLKKYATATTGRKVTVSADLTRTYEIETSGGDISHKTDKVGTFSAVLDLDNPGTPYGNYYYATAQLTPDAAYTEASGIDVENYGLPIGTYELGAATVSCVNIKNVTAYASTMAIDDVKGEEFIRIGSTDDKDAVKAKKINNRYSPYIKDKAEEDAPETDPEPEALSLTGEDEGEFAAYRETDAVKWYLGTKKGSTYKTYTDQLIGAGIITLSIAEYEFDIRKGLTGRKWHEDDEFEFNVTLDSVSTDTTTANAVIDTEPIPVSITSADADEYTKTVEMHFTAPGEYIFKISEISGDITGVDYDETVYWLKITVGLTTDDELIIIGAKKSTDGKTYSDVSEFTAEFSNEYESETTWTPSVKKTLDGRDWTADDEFKFTIALDADNSELTDSELAAADQKAALIDSVVIPNSGEISVKNNDLTKSDVTKAFGDITFKKAGKYVFTLTEQKPASNPSDGITYDKTEYEITVEIGYDDDGELTVEGVTAKITTDSEGKSANTGYTVTGNTFEFTNTYTIEKKDKVELSVKKLLSNGDWVDGDSFTFAVAGNDDATKAAIANSSDTGAKIKITDNITIDNDTEDKTTKFEIDFDNIDVSEGPVTYTFILSENEPAEHSANIVYDKNYYIVTVVLEDDGSGKLKHTVEVTRHDVESGSEINFTATPLPFTNKYRANWAPEVIKTLNGMDWEDLTETFTFEVTVDGDHSDTVSALAAGKIIFPDSTNNKAALTIDSSNEGAAKEFEDIMFTEAGTYRFKLKEQQPAVNPSKGITYDTTEYTITVVVGTDGTSKKLAVTSVTADNDHTGGAFEFENTYEPDPISLTPGVTKTVTVNGEQPDSTWSKAFSFTLATENDGTKTAIENGDIVFGSTAGSVDAEGVIETITVNKTAANADEATAQAFKTITFKKVGTYYFTISEVVPANNPSEGITYTTKTYTLKIEVSDDHEGKLIFKTETLTGNSINVTESGGTPKDVALSGTALTYDCDFVNYYGSTPATWTPTISKKLTGREWKTTDSFTFTLALDDEELPTGVTAADVTLKDPTSITIGGHEGADGALFTGTFGAVEFKKPGVYTFTITEANGGIGGITYDSAKTVTVTVTDNKDGTMSAAAAVTTVTDGNGAEASVVAQFINTYSAATATWTPTISKTLTGREWKTTDAFTFTLALDDEELPAGVTAADVTLKDPTSITIGGHEGADGALFTGTFGAVEFKKPGVYTFTITEANGGIGGITYDSAKTVTVTVTDNKDGTMSATATVTTVTDGDGAEASVVAQFINTYSAATAAWTPTISKKLTGREWKTTDAFTFTLALDETKLPTGATAADVTLKDPTSITIGGHEGADGALFTGTFGAVEFKKPGVYTFTITEANGGIGGITYDSAKTVTVTVTDNKDGTMSAAATVTTVTDGDGAEASVVAQFINTYSAATATWTPTISKTLTGREWKTTDAFTFTLALDETKLPTGATAADVTLKDPTSITIGGHEGADGALFTGTFGAVEFKKPGVYTFTITEANGGTTANGITYDSAKTVTVTVTDNKDGTMSAAAAVTTVTDGDGAEASVVAQFINTYSAASVTWAPEIKKTLTGIDWTNETFTFKVTLDAEKSSIPENATVSDYVEIPSDLTIGTTGSGNTRTGTFGNIKFKKPGTYTLKIGEGEIENSNITPATADYTVTVVVEDNKAGQLTIASYSINGAEAQSSAPGAFEFTNIYAPEEVDWPLKVKKDLQGREWNPDNSDRFTFTIEADDTKNPADVTFKDNKTTVTVTDDSEAMFGDITFTKAGTYYFTVTEAIPSGAVDNVYKGITYQSVSYIVTVVVRDSDGTLVIDSKAVAYADDDSAGITTDNGALVFVNTYSVESETWTPEVNVSKTLVGRNWTEKDGFYFTLELDTDNLPEGVTEEDVILPDNLMIGGEAAPDGTEITGTFGEVEFKKPGSYTFKLREVNGGTTANGITYDDTEYTLVVNVVDNLDGTLTVTLESGDQTAAFENIYDPTNTKWQAGVYKKVEGKTEWDSEYAFEFTLTAVSDNAKALLPISETITITDADDAHTKYFSELTFAAAGEYKFTIQETKGSIADMTYDTALYEVTVTVTDNGDGTLDISDNLTGHVLTITNTYTEPEAPPPTKPDPQPPTGPEKPQTDPIELIKIYEGLTLSDLSETERNAILSRTIFKLTYNGEATHLSPVYENGQAVVRFELFQGRSLSANSTYYLEEIQAADGYEKSNKTYIIRLENGKITWSEDGVNFNSGAIRCTNLKKPEPKPPVDPDPPAEPEPPVIPDQPAAPQDPTGPGDWTPVEPIYPAVKEEEGTNEEVGAGAGVSGNAEAENTRGSIAVTITAMFIMAAAALSTSKRRRKNK